MWAACRVRRQRSTLCCAKSGAKATTRSDFDRTVKEGVADVVARQTGMGIDVVSDGETGKIGYSTYVKERLSGFGGDSKPKPHRDLADHPEFRRRMTLFMRGSSRSSGCAASARSRSRTRRPCTPTSPTSAPRSRALTSRSRASSMRLRRASSRRSFPIPITQATRPTSRRSPRRCGTNTRPSPRPAGAAARLPGPGHGAPHRLSGAQRGRVSRARRVSTSRR